MAIYLVRHAHAGNRSSWNGDDTLRPLSKRGWAQAAHIAETLADAKVARVYSSPSTRCVETVQPLAEQHGLAVKDREELQEGSDPEAALDLLRNHTKHDTVLCTHGDLIPKLIRRLSASGMRTNDANISQKGSIWELAVEGGQITEGRYHPPSSARTSGAGRPSDA